MEPRGGASIRKDNASLRRRTKKKEPGGRALMILILVLLFVFLVHRIRQQLRSVPHPAPAAAHP